MAHFRKRLELRLDDLRFNLLNYLSKKTGIKKSDLIRWAIDFALKSEDAEAILKIKAKEYRAFSLLEDVKTKKTLLAMYKHSKNWLNYVEQIREGKIKGEPQNPKFSVFYGNNETLLNDFIKTQKLLVNALEDYVKGMKENDAKGETHLKGVSSPSLPLTYLGFGGFLPQNQNINKANSEGANKWRLKFGKMEK